MATRSDFCHRYNLKRVVFNLRAKKLSLLGSLSRVIKAKRSGDSQVAEAGAGNVSLAINSQLLIRATSICEALQSRRQCGSAQ